MTRKCTKCSHISTSMFRKKHRCVLCGSQTKRNICRKLKDLREPGMNARMPLKD